MIASGLVGLIMILHFYFMYLEMFQWTTPRGLKAFGQTIEQAKASKVLAANQGLYNGFLAAGLGWSLAQPNLEFALQTKAFFLACVLIAGLYGAATVGRKILFIQALPALLGLIAVFLKV